MANADHKQSKTTRLLIATPSYDAQVHTGYALSLVKTFAHFQMRPKLEMVHQFRLHDCSIPRARNHFAAYFLSDPTLTHLLFIDADISWMPEHIEKLLNDKKPIVAATFPMKKYIWEKLRTSAVKEIILNDKLSPQEFQQKIKARLVDYAIGFGESREINDYVIEVKQVATAFMLIERQVFEKMLAAYPERKVNNFNDLPEKVQNHLYSLFEQENIEGEYLSSDYSFCRLWRNIGGKVYADLSITLSHHGSEDFSGNIMEVSHFQTKPFPPSAK